MIYIDTSVLLADLLEETRRPDASFWTAKLISSKLLEYETFVRLHALKTSAQTLATAEARLGNTKLIDLDPQTLARALQPFPVGVRTLDALHLATMAYLQVRGLNIRLATYDQRLGQAALAIGVPLYGMDQR